MTIHTEKCVFQHLNVSTDQKENYKNSNSGWKHLEKKIKRRILYKKINVRTVEKIWCTCMC